MILASSAQAQNLRLVSVNLCQYPAPFGWRDVAQRSLKFVEKLKQLNPDVVLIQETWSSTSQQLLYFLLRRSFPFAVLDQNPPKFGWGGTSGLMILSKHKIKNFKRKTFTLFRGEDNFSRKGVVGAKILVGPTETEVDVFTTHLQAGGYHILTEKLDQNKPNTSEIRAHQASEINEFISSFSTNSDTPIILGGDLNTDAEELSDFLQQLPGFTTSLNFEKSDALGTVWNLGEVEPKVIDWFLTKNSPHIESYITQIFDSSVTDHLGIVADFNY